MTGINRHLGRFLLFLSKLPLSVKRLAKKKGVGGLLLPSCGPSISGLNVLESLVVSEIRLQVRGEDAPWEWRSLLRDRHSSPFPCQKLWIKLWIRGSNLWIAVPIHQKVVNRWRSRIMRKRRSWVGPSRRGSVLGAIHASRSEPEMPSIHNTWPKTPIPYLIKQLPKSGLLFAHSKWCHRW